MKILFKKLKQSNKIFLIIYFATFFTYLVSYIFIVNSLVHLSGIETTIRIIVITIFGIWLLIYFLWNLVNLILKKYIKLTITSIFTVLFIILFFIASYYIDTLYKGIDNLTESDYVTYTSNLITKENTIIDKDSVLGMINSSDDIEGNILAKELIKDKKLTKNKLEEYSSYYEMISDLLNENIDGIFLTSNYLSIFGGDDGFEELKETKVYYSFSKKMPNQDKHIVSNKSIKEPFTILLIGVDSAIEGLNANTAFNGDTLMMITFNPQTLNATMFSIPRDTYVPIACNNNRYAKINSSAAYGTSCVIDTIEQLTDINIDYYVKVNFSAVIDLVEALDGIDVEVEAPTYGVYSKQHDGKICEASHRAGGKIICVEPGSRHLNGIETLVYARCRHGYLDSDIARNRHQQLIIEAIAKKMATPSIIDKFEDILNSISNNLATNMSTEQILSFYDVLKSMLGNVINDEEFITIEKTYLEYYDLRVRTSQNGYFTSAIGHYPDSLDAIVHLMKQNLGLEEREMTKTFEFDANEKYSTRPTGRGIKTGERLQTMPSFIGKSTSDVETWAEAHEIALTKEFVNSDNKYYNADIAPGLVANQSINNGVLLKNISELTIYINTNNSSNEVPNDNKDSSLSDILPIE